MDPISLNLSSQVFLSSNQNSRRDFTKIHPQNYGLNFSPSSRGNLRSISISGRAVSDPSAVSADPEVTWQIVVGALAGVTPFVVAGIEFSKRIVAQRKCKACGGSGLVLRDNKYYFRCPSCGGFLPWQSWRRFFTG